MLKIGIATVHDSSNLGSYLQALSMQELVKEHGDEPIIIETRSKFSTFSLFLGYNNAKSARSLKSAARFAFHVLMNPAEIKIKYQKYRAYRKDWAQFEQIYSVKKVNKLGLDCLLLGSDEIWNMNKPAFQNPLLYGIGINSVRKIGYAVSVGNVTAKKMSSFPELLRGIEALDAVLYRDMHTQETLHALQLHAEAGICDPTIQVDIWKYMKKPEEVLLPEYDYIAVYSYYIDDTRKSQIQRFAKEHELKIVAVSLPLDWCDFYLNCSPLEFGAVLSKAKYVFTSTFHGTIFASLYHMRFVSLPALPKVADVLFLLGLEDHILPENADYYTLNEMLEHDYCFEEMEKRLEQLRAESYDCYEKFVKGW